MYCNLDIGPSCTLFLCADQLLTVLKALWGGEWNASHLHEKCVITFSMGHLSVKAESHQVISGRNPVKSSRRKRFDEVRMAACCMLPRPAIQQTEVSKGIGIK